jgi:SpoVK/Ycf46/Vps4 family AAA+-type ATPase
MLDRNPNIHWTDIADHKEAKRLLEEAVVLPRLMPDYFRGMCLVRCRRIINPIFRYSKAMERYFNVRSSWYR